MKIIFVGGARPNFMKIAPLMREIKKYKRFKPVIVHTGQHYDYEMSKVFFEDLNIGKPHYCLNVGSATHAYQTAEMMKKFEKVCIREKPELVVVVGDVNSTLACSVVSKKMHIKVAHIEAGLRSKDLDMPEEINRIITDSISDFLFVTEKSAINNLKREGKNAAKIYFVGNTMIDSLVFGLKKLNKINLKKLKVYLLKNELGNYSVVTLHRPSNVDNKPGLLRLIKILNKISDDTPLVFPIHPRAEKNIKILKSKLSKNIHIIKPLGYLEFLFLCKDAKFVLTDSGGIQEEATFLKIPCFTLRENTERPVTMEMGTNILIGQNIDKTPSVIFKFFKAEHKRGKIPPLWDGKTAERIIKILNKIL